MTKREASPGRLRVILGTQSPLLRLQLPNLYGPQLAPGTNRPERVRMEVSLQGAMRHPSTEHKRLPLE